MTGTRHGRRRRLRACASQTPCREYLSRHLPFHPWRAGARSRAWHIRPCRKRAGRPVRQRSARGGPYRPSSRSAQSGAGLPPVRQRRWGYCRRPRGSGWRIRWSGGRGEDPCGCRGSRGPACGAFLPPCSARPSSQCCRRRSSRRSAGGPSRGRRPRCASPAGRARPRGSPRAPARVR